MTDDTDPHPIGKTSLYERMSDIAREAGGHPAPTPIEAARAHLGVSDRIPEQTVIESPGEQLVSLADSGIADGSRGSVEQAMIAGTDPVTGELPCEEEEDAQTDRIIEEQGSLAAVHGERAPPLAAETVSVSNAVHEEITPQPAAPTPPHPERQTFNSAPPPPINPAAKQEVIEPERAADGAPAPYAASTLGELVNLLEGGQLSADAILAVSALGQGMRELAERTGKRQKGRVAINLNLVTDDTGEAFFVEAEFKVTAPKEPRRKTMLWQDDKGRMTPSQPRQRVFFGVKDVGDAPRQIRQIP